MDLINTCFEMCDYIEQNGVVRLAGNVKLRDNLKKELLHFLIYISMTDGRYGEEEKAFIKKKLGFDVSVCEFDEQDDLDAVFQPEPQHAWCRIYHKSAGDI